MRKGLINGRNIFYGLSRETQGQGAYKKKEQITGATPGPNCRSLV